MGGGRPFSARDGGEARGGQRTGAPGSSRDPGATASIERPKVSGGSAPDTQGRIKADLSVREGERRTLGVREHTISTDASCGRQENAHPGATEDVPLVDAEVHAQLLDVLDEVPRRVVLERREPGTTQHRHRSDSATAGAQWRSQRGLAHGVDLPDPRWSKRTICEKSSVILDRGPCDKCERRTLYLVGSKNERSFASVPPPGPPCKKTTGNRR